MAPTVAQATDGVITATATGGTGTITYSKDNGTTFASNVSSAVCRRNHQIKSKDANCVSAVTAVSITAPTPLPLVLFFIQWR
jgi:hypothetical protein